MNIAHLSMEVWRERKMGLLVGVEHLVDSTEVKEWEAIM
jgi:hypothetical protein